MLEKLEVVSALSGSSIYQLAPRAGEDKCQINFFIRCHIPNEVHMYNADDLIANNL